MPLRSNKLHIRQDKTFNKWMLTFATIDCLRVSPRVESRCTLFLKKAGHRSGGTWDSNTLIYDVTNKHRGQTVFSFIIISTALKATAFY